MNRRGQRLRYYEEEVALLVVAAAGRDLGDAALAQQLPRRADEVDDAAQARLHVEQLLELVDLLHGCVTQTLTENKQNVDFKSERRGNWRWPMDNGGCQREMDYLKKKITFVGVARRRGHQVQGSFRVGAFHVEVAVVIQNTPSLATDRSCFMFLFEMEADLVDGSRRRYSRRSNS